ncbi:hypothetical protein GGR51DRAFT_513963 [Nemania sp. FL0031]|nr:hypothetical protein GGR51DRAFT_513963 [Nemania sp. FL0031]
MIHLFTSMEVKCQVIRPKDARQYRKRSVSTLPRPDSTQGSASSRYVEYSKASTAPLPPLDLALSPNTYERLAAAKRAQDGLVGHVRAEAMAMRERQYEELGTIRRFRELAAREKREREEALRQQQMDDFKLMMIEFETRRAIEEEDRIAEAIRREEARASIREAMIQMRDEATRQRQLEHDRILAEQMEAAARVEEARIQAQEEAEERERIRRERLRECSICMEEDDMRSMAQAPCAHWYCHGDLQTAFQNALDGRQPFRCCHQEVPVDLCPTTTEDFRERYRLMILELTTPNPVYCSNRACGRFVPPAQYEGPDIAACQACRSRACRICRNASHAGICPQDVGMQQAVALATRNGWRSCPRCNNMVEKRSGCNHMTCRCGGEFCYVCGGAWGSCRTH